MLNILNWSEAWAPLIPLYVYIFKSPSFKYLKIIAAYLLTALIINIVIDVSWIFKPCMPVWFQNNNIFYNINSILRTIVFTFFFRNIITIISKRYLVIVLIFYFIFFLAYFIVNKNFRLLSSWLHATESIILLAYSIIYFIELIKSDEIFLAFDPYLLIVSGIAIYESVNFFVFLFYEYFAHSNKEFAHYIWYISNVAFVVFCILIAKAFWGSFKKSI